MKIAKKYLKSLYDCGGMSGDVYYTVDSDLSSSFKESDFLDKSDKEIKIMILDHLNDCGGISYDVYEMELESIS